MARRVPLSSRPLDFLYFVFMLVRSFSVITPNPNRESHRTALKTQIHIPATVLLDMQAIIPQNLAPKVLRDASEWYISFSGDPLIAGAFHGGPEWNWFRSFLYLEACVQSDSRPSPRSSTIDRFSFLGFSNYPRFSSR